MKKCPKCKSDTVLLDELADDSHLDEKQTMEEQIGSVNWRVYVCPGCDFTRTVASNRWFSGYSSGRGCQARTLKSTSTTLTYATYDHGGTVQVNESCVRCPYRNSYTRSTPQRTRSRAEDLVYRVLRCAERWKRLDLGARAIPRNSQFIERL